MPSKPKKPATKPKGADSQKKQSERFKEAARVLQADESGEAFEQIAKTILRPIRRKDS